jgi:DNA-binding MarR family transcriptional regulator/GNAT superfamily N-acetyltransferase
MTKALVAPIRHHSRQLLRELGVLNSALPGIGLSSSAVHAIVELGFEDGLTARDLSSRLLLEKSTISRLVKSLVAKGLVSECPDPADRRAKRLSLTPEGTARLDQINRLAVTRVSDALDQVSAREGEAIREGLRLYAGALAAARNDSTPPAPTIRTGYTPGLLGRIVTLHARYYSTLIGFDLPFEATVATGMADFLPRLANPANGTWWIDRDGDIVGGISIDGEDLGDGVAHLRWFILDPALHGSGLGNSLLETALAHCRAHGFSRVDLWTFSGLDAARSLYEKHGFALVSETTGTQWGKPVQEQKFSLALG